VTNFVSLTVTTNSMLQIERVGGNDYRFTIGKGRSDVDYALEQSATLCSCSCQAIWESLGTVSPTAIPYSFVIRNEHPLMFFRLKEIRRP
jgi:hypothetical protein